MYWAIFCYWLFSILLPDAFNYDVLRHVAICFCLFCAFSYWIVGNVQFLQCNLVGGHWRVRLPRLWFDEQLFFLTRVLVGSFIKRLLPLRRLVLSIGHILILWFAENKTKYAV